MNLYIRIKNGEPFEHPIFEDNFRAAFPDVDTDNLPPEFARFERVPRPLLGVYEVYVDQSYQNVGGVYKDVHQTRDMTPEEIAAKQQEVRDTWAAGPNWTSWTFDEETCLYYPPVEKPSDGLYNWDEATLSWVPAGT